MTFFWQSRAAKPGPSPSPVPTEQVNACPCDRCSPHVFHVIIDFVYISFTFIIVLFFHYIKFLPFIVRITNTACQVLLFILCVDLVVIYNYILCSHIK